MSNVPLTTVKEHNYLGICLYHKLSWKPHVDRICNKANRLLGFLKWNLYNASPQIKEYTYKQLLLPSVKYCSAIWDPYHQGDILKLEMIQHRAARFVLNKPWHRNQQNDSITDMLSSLTWPSLEDCQKAAQLILLFKILRNLFVVPDRCLPTLTPLHSTRAHTPSTQACSYTI